MTYIKWSMRQDPWNVHKNCFKTIENTGIILSSFKDKTACDSFTLDENDIFFTEVDIGDKVIIYEKQNNNNALVVEVTSIPYRKNIPEIKIYRKDGYINDHNTNVVEVCYEKTKTAKEYDSVEDMDAYVRDVKILGYVFNNESYTYGDQLFSKYFDFQGEIFLNTCEECKNVSYVPYYNLSSNDDLTYQMFRGTNNIPPGFMQYKHKKEDILNLNIEYFRANNVSYKTNFELEENSEENLLRLIPDTRTGNANEWELIFVIKETNKRDLIDDICIKGALLNKNTKEIALMSSLNESSSIKYKQENHKTLKSKDEKWEICRSKMIANLFFWDELKKRVIQMEESEQDVKKKITKFVRNPELQNKFRKDIKNRFGNCIITDMYEDVCEACHIKPFSISKEDECFNINNGLLFNCLIHKLFDKYDISINPKTLRVEISKKCINYKFISQYDNMYLSKLEPYDEIRTFLKFHYDIFINQ